jgi:CHAD domain-containing protein
MAVNSTQTRTRSNARAGRSPKTSATPAASTRRTRPGRVSPAPLHPAPIAGSRPRPSASAAEVVQAYLKVQVAKLRSLEPKVCADEFDSVHQMRVATRRLRATLRSFGMVIPRSATAKVAGELKWLGGLLGGARDGEVLPRHLLASLETVPVELLIGPVQARVQGHFAPLRAAAREQVIEAFGSVRYAKLLANLDQLAHDPPRGPQAGALARDVLPAAVRKAYRQARRRMRRARQAPVGEARDVALHEARKSRPHRLEEGLPPPPPHVDALAPFARQQARNETPDPVRLDAVRPRIQCAANELGTKNSVSHIETDVLRDVRLVPRCGNVAGIMRHLVLIACRSGA